MRPGKSELSNSTRAHSICESVVPHFGGVEMITSPGRGSNSSHRALSEIKLS